LILKYTLTSGLLAAHPHTWQINALLLEFATDLLDDVQLTHEPRLSLVERAFGAMAGRSDNM